MTKEIIYLSELTLPPTSAQSLQILKMCDNFSKFKNVKLIIKNSQKDYSFLCRDKNGWIKKILKLKVDKTFNEKFILNSLIKIEKSYFLDSNMIKLENILRKIDAN